MKKTICLVLCAILLASLWGCGEELPEELEYRLKEDGSAALVACSNRELTEAVVPSEYKGSPVTEICYNAFEDCVSLQRLELPESIKTIGSSAFKNCSALEKINLPDSIGTIEARAFEGCSALKELQLPKGLQKLEKELFKNCVSLARPELPEGLTLIEGSAFEGCSFSVFDYDLSKITVEDLAVNDCFWCNVERGEAELHFCGPDDTKYIDVPADIEGCPVTKLIMDGGNRLKAVEDFNIPASIERVDEDFLLRLATEGLSAHSLFPQLCDAEEGWETGNAVDCTADPYLPDWGPILPFERDYGYFNISGELYNLLPADKRSCSVSGAGAVLFTVETSKMRDDYLGAAYDVTKDVYIANIETGELLKLYTNTKHPPAMGQSPLYADETTNIEIWLELAKIFN